MCNFVYLDPRHTIFLVECTVHLLLSFVFLIFACGSFRFCLSGHRASHLQCSVGVLFVFFSHLRLLGCMRTVPCVSSQLWPNLLLPIVFVFVHLPCNSISSCFFFFFFGYLPIPAHVRIHGAQFSFSRALKNYISYSSNTNHLARNLICSTLKTFADDSRTYGQWLLFFPSFLTLTNYFNYSNYYYHNHHHHHHHHLLFTSG